MEHQVIWEAPPIVKPEFRLYYDERGKVITYTCDKLEGTYIVIDALTFAEARQDIRVVDGKLSRIVQGAMVSKLVQSQSGTKCAEEDVSVVLREPIDSWGSGDGEYKGKQINWSLQTNEL